MNELKLIKLFSKNLRELMEGENITQKELSNKIGINQSLISRYVSGQSIPSFLTVVKLAEVFCCSLDEFLNEN